MSKPRMFTQLVHAILATVLVVMLAPSARSSAQMSSAKLHAGEAYASALLALPDLGIDPWQVPGAESLLRIEHTACNDTETYFIMWLLPDAAPNHYLFEATLDVQGGASIDHIFPLSQGSLSDRLTQAITISLTGELLRVPLGGTVLAVVDTTAQWLLERQHARASLSPFTVTWYDTASQVRIGFLVHATHPAGGGVTLSTQWARTGQETVSRSMTMPVCSPLLTASAGPQGQTTTPGGAPADVTRVTRNADWTPVVQEFDGVEMVLVPPGCFMMGSDLGESHEKPVHRICFDQPFWIDRYEVTNAQRHMIDSDWKADDTPLVKVSWYEAWDFCQVRGARLPTEAEWEYAARGPDGLQFPWGNLFIGANVAYKQNASGPTDVRAHPKGVSWVGAFDMSGNVWEWTSTLYRDYPYDASDGRELYTTDGASRVFRGGSWFNEYSDYLRGASRGRGNPGIEDSTIGFRCARSQ